MRRPAVLWPSASALLGALLALFFGGPGLAIRLRTLGRLCFSPAEATLQGEAPLQQAAALLGAALLLLLLGAFVGLFLGAALRWRLLGETSHGARTGGAASLVLVPLVALFLLPRLAELCALPFSGPAALWAPVPMVLVGGIGASAVAAAQELWHEISRS